jgi:protein disulfide-isomerase
MADKCTAIVKYHMGLDAIYRNAVYTPWMIIYEHPYEASLVSEVNVRVEVAQTPLDKPAAGLGLEGYCPVTLANEQKWVKGNPNFAANLDGVTYQFAGADELQSFLDEPQRYAPAYGGIDVVRLVDEQTEIPGMRKHGISYERKIYLFESEKSLEAFQSAPAKYIAKAESAAVR